MSARRQIEKRIHALGEIREIMGAMKNLALLETRRVKKALDVQRDTRQYLVKLSSRFLQAHPQLISPHADNPSVVLVLGAERGFCGDYNKRLLNALESYGEDHSAPATVILVGQRLGASAQLGSVRVVQLAGANVGEEINDVLTRVATTLAGIEPHTTLDSLLVCRHPDESSKPTLEPLFPTTWQQYASGTATADEPELTLPPEVFFAGLLETYLAVTLREMLSSALAAENLFRVRHLSGSISHLDDRIAELERKGRMLRQEEMIEEIEVLLLGGDTGTPPVPRAQPPRRRDRRHNHT